MSRLASIILLAFFANPTLGQHTNLQEYLDRLPPEVRNQIPNTALPEPAPTLVEPEQEPQPQFSTTDLRTRPIILEEAVKDYVVDIEILRWGKVENGQTFSIALQSQPEFVENIRLDKTSINLPPEKWSEELTLTFDIKETTTDANDGRLTGDILFTVTSSDKSLTPAERKFTIPLRYYAEQEDDGRSIFVTTVREDFTGTVGVYETHLECHAEDITLFTVDPLWIFFKGFPPDETFFYKLIGPDGEEIETMPYNPGQDFGSGILSSLEGAISPMFKVFDEFEYGESHSIPWAAGTYIVQVAYQKQKANDHFGSFMEYGEFRDIGSFELVNPVLRYRGAMVVDEKRKPGHGAMSASAGGSSATVEGAWTKRGMDNQIKNLGVRGSINFDYPRELAWSKDKLSYEGSISVSGSASGHEGERKETLVALTFARGFIIADSIGALTELKPGGGLKFIRDNGSVKLQKRKSGEYYGTFGVDMGLPTFTYPQGEPKRLFGWHLRNPSNVFAILHNVTTSPVVIGGMNPVSIMAIYGSDPEGIAATSIEGAKKDDEEESVDEPTEETAEEEEEEEEPSEVADASTGNDETNADEPSSNETSSSTSDSASIGGPGGAGAFVGGSAASPSPGASRGSLPTGSQTERTASHSGQADTAGDPARSDSASSGTTEPTVPEQSAGGTLEQNAQLDGALQSNDPARIPPNHPQVSEFITQWIRQAKPPANVDPEVNLRYNEWGNIEGKAKGGVITQNDRPDAAAGMTSSEYLWAFNRSLDSLGHCQLGDWVMARLQGTTLSGCSSRFSRPSGFAVPNLVGQHLDQAERLTMVEGLIPVIEIGPPAPKIELEGFIAQQDPPQGSLVEKGGTVALTIYTNFVGGSSVPDLAGQSVDQAEEALRKAGYTMELQLGDAPPSFELAERIQKQVPTPNTALTPDSPVTVWVYDHYVAPPQPFVPAPAIEPAFSPDAETSTLPDLVGLTANEAELILLENAVLMRRLKGPAAANPELASTIQSQNPKPGAQFALLEEVEVVVYDQQSSEAPAPKPESNDSPQGQILKVPSRLGSLALWNGRDGDIEKAQASYINPLTRPETSRFESDWIYPIGGGEQVHGATAIYGIPGSKRVAAIGLIWEESADARSEDIQCGSPYESEAFWDSDDTTIGRVTSRSKRATVFFIAPNDLVSTCRPLIDQLLPEAEAFAKNCN